MAALILVQAWKNQEKKMLQHCTNKSTNSMVETYVRQTNISTIKFQHLTHTLWCILTISFAQDRNTFSPNYFPRKPCAALAFLCENSWQPVRDILHPSSPRHIHTSIRINLIKHQQSTRGPLARDQPLSKKEAGYLNLYHEGGVFHLEGFSDSGYHEP